MFFIVASFVMLFMALFSVRTLFTRAKYIRYGLLLFLMMYIAVGARVAIAMIGHNELFILLAWVGYVSIGVVSMLFCAAVVKLVFNTTGYFLTKTTDKFSPSRRQFLSNSLGTGMSLAVLPMAGYGIYRAVGKPIIKKVNLTNPNIHEGLKGLRIAQLTDIHVGPTIGAEKVEQIVGMTNELNPDIVLITGDLVDGSAKYISDYILPLKDLKSTYGTFFVTGNHEYYSGAKAWIKAIESLGIIVLNNTNRILKHKGAGLMVAGVPDIHADRFGFETHKPAKAKHTNEHYDYSIIMSHRPEVADEIAEHGFDLQLSGHTHGGQYFPWTFVIYAFQRYVRGLYKIGDMKLYVSQGTAYWGPPMRIGAESEITLLTL
ncbi:MAG: phosphohydrolase [Denitrovibrio sp.]|nr:MAG: phosphohydrolase [Denitrovibrio sp.]